MYRFFAAGMLATLLALSARANSLDDFNQGMEAHNLGDNNVAINAFTRALAAGDLNRNLRAISLIDRGAAYRNEKRYSEAVADFTAALALDPGRYDATYERMSAYERNAQGLLAAADCEALIKMRPKFADTYERCGLIKWENGDFVKAVPDFETAVNLGTTPLVFPELWLEIARRRAGMPDEAEFAELTERLGLDRWPQQIFDLYLGKSDPDSVLAAAEKSDGGSSVSEFSHFEDIAQHFDDDTQRFASETASSQLRRCQAAFFVGEWQLLRRNIAQARAILGETNAYCPDWIPAEKEIARLTPK